MHFAGRNLTPHAKFFFTLRHRYNVPMLPVREQESANDYHGHLALIRARILGFVTRRLVPHRADFADAEDIAQTCIVVLVEQYAGKRDLAEMTAIAVGVARHKIARFLHDRERAAVPDLHALPSPDALFDQLAARESMDRLLRAMLKLSDRCRDLLRLQLIEQRDYAEIRILLGISGNIYEMTRRCHKALLRIAGGAV
jgi:DNA-directed RNA polymerase specialized sigma24 family protein